MTVVIQNGLGQVTSTHFCHSLILPYSGQQPEYNWLQLVPSVLRVSILASQACFKATH